jgi:acetoin utilization deacetylase AcuC-like enzyme
MLALRQAGLVTSPLPFPPVQYDFGILPQASQPLIELAAAPAEDRDILLVHPERHLQRVRQKCELGGYLDQGDTPVGPGSFEAAMMAVGMVLTCCDAVAEGEVRRAFTPVRPPGHHAETNAAMGFCLFSNVAIAARHLIQRRGVARVAIVDFDVHHGNGTQAIFAADSQVFYASIHEDAAVCYPHSGYAWERGVGAGRGATLNCPLPVGSGDGACMLALTEQVIPALEKFRPEFLLLSAGFDAHHADPLAELRLTEEGYDAMTRRLVSFADATCGGRIVSVLEGGYDLRSLGRCVVRHVMALQH